MLRSLPRSGGDALGAALDPDGTTPLSHAATQSSDVEDEGEEHDAKE